MSRFATATHRAVRLSALCALLAVALTGCASLRPAPSPMTPTNTAYPFVTATERPTPTPVTPSATPTATPTPTATFTPTATPGPSVTPTPSPTAVPTATRTLTPSGFLYCPYPASGVFRQVVDARQDIKLAVGCPLAQDNKTRPKTWPVEARWQPMEHGSMLWVSNVGWYDGAVIYVILEDGTYTRYDDTYTIGGDPSDGGPPPPDGLYRPTEALGKVWRIIPGLIEQIGFATQPEITYPGDMQLFQYGDMVTIPPLSGVGVFIRGETDRWTLIPILLPVVTAQP